LAIQADFGKRFFEGLKMGLFASVSPLNNWYLVSQDFPLETVVGQFPTEITEAVSVEYAQYKSLNRATPILQFVSGNADTLTFTARFHSRDAVFGGVKESVAQLKKWARRDPKLQRPQILSFTIGDGYSAMDSCVIQELGSIAYKKPTALGAIREVSVSINLIKYEDFAMSGDPLIYETRYHRVKEGEYYESLCQNEYNNAYFGDIIRKRHPQQQTLKPGDIVKLPSIEAIQTERLEPKSLILKSAYGRKETEQRTARLNKFDERNQTYTSHVVIG